MGFNQSCGGNLTLMLQNRDKQVIWQCERADFYGFQVQTTNKRLHLVNYSLNLTYR